jgi:hypothetical protein
MALVSIRMPITPRACAWSLWATLVVVALAAAPTRSLAGGAAADSLALPPPSVRRWQTGVLRPDRLTHSSLALAIGVGVGMMRRAPAAGAGAACGIGLAKELTDDHFDRGDLAADAIGAGLAACIVAALTR